MFGHLTSAGDASAFLSTPLHLDNTRPIFYSILRLETQSAITEAMASPKQDNIKDVMVEAMGHLELATVHVGIRTQFNETTADEKLASLKGGVAGCQHYGTSSHSCCRSLQRCNGELGCGGIQVGVNKRKPKTRYLCERSLMQNAHLSRSQGKLTLDILFSSPRNPKPSTNMWKS